MSDFLNWGFDPKDLKEENFISKSYGVFGLNRAKIISVEFFESNGDNNSYLLVKVRVNDKIYQLRAYNPDNGIVYFNGEQISPNDSNYKNAFIKKVNKTKGYVLHIAKSLGITDDTLKSALANVSSFDEFINAIISLYNGDEVPVDVFLEWETSIPENYNSAFLRLPRNMSSGYFIVPEQKGNFEEIIDSKGLTYISVTGVLHPFHRSTKFLESSKGTQLINNKSENTVSSTSNKWAKK